MEEVMADEKKEGVNEEQSQPNPETPEAMGEGVDKDKVQKLMEKMMEEHLSKDHPEMLKLRKGTAALMKEVNDFIEKRAVELGLSASVNNYMGRVVTFHSSEESQEKAENKEAKENAISVTTLTLALADADNHVADVYAKGFGHVIHELNSNTLRNADE
jgi:hypothetical protein